MYESVGTIRYDTSDNLDSGFIFVPDSGYCIIHEGKSYAVFVGNSSGTLVELCDGELKFKAAPSTNVSAMQADWLTLQTLVAAATGQLKVKIKFNDLSSPVLAGIVVPAK